MERYADQFMGWLKDLGFTHCFFLAGGGSMHLVDAASKHFVCIPVVHEVSAVIATEYFNESNRNDTKAFALVTTGPGLTNAITGISGAWLESRDCLIIGGQVKQQDLARNGLRQKGIQEVDGTALVESITKGRMRIESPVGRYLVSELISLGESPRQGPVFIEICIDASAAPASLEYEANDVIGVKTGSPKSFISEEELQRFRQLLSKSTRPLLLLGSGVSQKVVLGLETIFEDLKLPIATTWSGADRSNIDYKYFAGRPNTYGMRWANVYQQQSDLLIAVGTRLNLQQTGFNFEEFMPVGRIVQVDLDSAELEKENPGIDLGLQVDANEFLKMLPSELEKNTRAEDRIEWIDYLELVKSELPIIESIHISPKPFLNPYFFINELSKSSKSNDVVVSCSSGGTFTSTHQSFQIKRGQQLISNKGLASMGYGLAGAIGAAFSNTNSRVLLLEGDGGFAQNLQELGTVTNNVLNIKMFIVCNDGYASIRSSQKSYFNDNYVGCDISTGLGLPKWHDICNAYGIEYYKMDSSNIFSARFQELMDSQNPVFFEISTDPNMLYFPKVASKILASGKMVSAAIHDMTPKLPNDVARKVFKYLPQDMWGV
jgi:acetolactate synthase-1/2/3 large subunit